MVSFLYDRRWIISLDSGSVEIARAVVKLLA